MNYVVNKNNPFMRKSKDCFHANSYEFTCMQCIAHEQANTEEHVKCFTPKPMQWTHNWIKVDDVQRMYAV